MYQKLPFSQCGIEPTTFGHAGLQSRKPALFCQFLLREFPVDNGGGAFGGIRLQGILEDIQVV